MTGRLDSSVRVRVDGHEVVTYSYGDSHSEILFLLNGGPGLPCDYLREPMLRMVEAGYRVVIHDQLGCGKSDHPADPKLWNIARYVEEVETVRKALGLTQIHLLGHSWGGWLAIEYAATYPAALKSLVLSSTCGDMPFAISELNRLREALGPETVAMMQRHEAAGSYEHPEYKAAITLLNYRHVHRLETLPAPLQASIDGWNMEPYDTMQGPNEFIYTGNLKEWNRIPWMRQFPMPCLVIVGEFDELTPANALLMHQALPRSEIAVLRNCSHLAMYEDPAVYFGKLTTFLAKHRDKAR